MGAIKMAVLGLNQGSKIARDASVNPEIDLVAVAGFGDHDAQVAQELEVPLYNDYTLLLKQVELDAIAIALPNKLHVESVELSLQAGIKNILLEKPIANTVEEAQHIIDICNEAGATLLVGHHRRSSSKYQFLREIIDSGRIGDIVGIQSNYAIAKPHSYYDVEWHTKKGGGPLLINAIHDFDDLNFVCGMTPARVYAAARNTVRGNEVEDSVSAVVEYKEGVTASYFISDATPSPWNYDLAAEENTFFTMCPGENSLRVFGTKGSFGFPNMDLYYYDENAFGWTSPLIHEHFEVEKNDPMTAELDHFVDLCMGRETKPRCTGENGLDTLKVINAILESVDTGAPVEL
ncbi:MAG: Gfo/Idh/MocA family oxidoreductase [Eggerthellaceae bacterium]